MEMAILSGPGSRTNPVAWFCIGAHTWRFSLARSIGIHPKGRKGAQLPSCGVAELPRKKLRYRGIAKNRHRLCACFALVNLYLHRKRLAELRAALEIRRTGRLPRPNTHPNHSVGFISRFRPFDFSIGQCHIGYIQTPSKRMHHQLQIKIPPDIPSPNAAVPESFWTLKEENPIFC